MIASLFIGFTSVYIAAYHYTAERTPWHLISGPATLFLPLKQHPAAAAGKPLEDCHRSDTAVRAP